MYMYTYMQLEEVRGEADGIRSELEQLKVLNIIIII